LRRRADRTAQGLASGRQIFPVIAKALVEKGNAMPAHARILNVDGTEFVRSSRTRALQQAGFEVREAGTGCEALTLATSEDPQVVLLAVDLPDISGFDVCRRLKADPPTARIPVLLVTRAFGLETDRINLESGADRYLEEPKEAELVAAVKACLRTRRIRNRVRFIARQWAATFNAISDGVALLGPEGRIVRCNSSFAQIAARPIGLLAGRRLHTVLASRPIGSSFDRLLESRARETTICSLGERWFQIALDPVFSDSGALAGAVCLLSDITERKRAEDALQEANQRLSSALSSFTDAYFALDLNWRLLEANPAAEQKIFKRPAGDLIDKVVWEEYPESFDAGFYRQCQIAVAEQKPVHFEAQSANADSWFEASAYPRRDRIEVYLRDISDRKRAEEERAQCLVREQEARKEAEVASRLKDDFLAKVSHELRTPLNSVIGWTNLLRAGKLDEASSAHALEIIERNAEAQARMVDDLLDAARIVSGKFRLDLRPLDLQEVVVTAVDALKPAASGKGLEIQTVLDGTSAKIFGDPNRLRQIVWNLLSNSIKFTPKGGRIEVRLTQSRASVKIIVSDTGIGIKPSLLPHIFDWFHQGANTKPQAGLGLGLAIARTLVELHRGDITADSPGEGQGSTFTVLLPLMADSTAGAERASDNRPAIGPSTLQGLRILVVDDEPGTVELLAAALTSYGAEIVTATSAAEARERIGASAPDVLVSELEMPDEDGCNLISSLRAFEHEQGKRMPAIALTAHSRPEDRTRALLSGFHVHVRKPVAPDELASIILRLTSRSR
jgi:signal transduction histidine kinase/response regulator RpfG family c-di-GMP phosphodiesterase